MPHTDNTAALLAFTRELLQTYWQENVRSGPIEMTALNLEDDCAGLQDLAAKHGLLVPHKVTEPCCEECACAEYSEFPTTCYRVAGWVQGEVDHG